MGVALRFIFSLKEARIYLDGATVKRVSHTSPKRKRGTSGQRSSNSPVDISIGIPFEGTCCRLDPRTRGYGPGWFVGRSARSGSACRRQARAGLSGVNYCAIALDRSASCTNRSLPGSTGLDETPKFRSRANAATRRASAKLSVETARRITVPGSA